MKSLNEIKHIIRQEKPHLKKRYDIEEIGIFGSYARNQQKQGSDVDILVDFGGTPKIDLFDLVGLEYYLTDLLDLKVQLAIKGSLKKRIGQRILEEVQII
jgi:predicted nucleotidyltransferase